MRTAASGEATRRTSSLRSGIARHDREAALGKFDPGAGFRIEAQFGLALGHIGTVAGKAVVGENRADIAIEFDLLAEQRSGSQHDEYANRAAAFP